MTPSPLSENIIRIADRLGFKSKTSTRLLIAAAIETGHSILKRPGIKATLESKYMQLVNQEPENQAYPEVVNNHINSIVSFFRRYSLFPERLGIDGVPGSGKSTLARLLAEKYNMSWRSLDHTNMEKAVDLSEKDTIYEHHRLFRTQNIDNFDAIIYIDEPVSLSMQKVLHRKRGGYLLELMNYELLKNVGKKAFEVGDGDIFNVPESFLKIKLRPAKGFKVMENLCRELEMTPEKASRFSKEQLLFISLGHRPRKGFTAYANPLTFTGDIFDGLLKGLHAASFRRS
ncbi:conserved hypothetical protein [Desulfamplus magnetovallimortis]|uniref:Uncharacterized protein n=1 Tax=Desulfamplus magnetovallimortis TaxID=1246637 RepID=A0A1W1H801_9BACT|nr:hypothetical protein [Desulfamplus magnetovallimortis]SLM28564.1 conserved hypothetical protein [Desulfamplus magnetovallimortis]